METLAALTQLRHLHTSDATVIHYALLIAFAGTYYQCTNALISVATAAVPAMAPAIRRSLGVRQCLWK